MVEQIIEALSDTPERHYQFAVVACLMLGATAGLLRRKPAELLGRTPYFALVAAIYFFFALGQSIWLILRHWQGEAVGLAVLVGAIFLTFSAGYAFGRISLARCHDAFGSGRLAFLALIPFVNLSLLVWPSQKRDEDASTAAPNPLAGARGVVIGLVLLVLGGGYGNYMDRQTSLFAVARPAAAMDPRSIVLAMIEEDGVEAVLEFATHAEETPEKFASNVIRTAVEADGKTLRRIYAVDARDFELTEEERGWFEEDVCTTVLYAEAIKAGATIVEVLNDADGVTRHRLRVTRDVCGF